MRRDCVWGWEGGGRACRGWGFVLGCAGLGAMMLESWLLCMQSKPSAVAVLGLEDGWVREVVDVKEINFKTAPTSGALGKLQVHLVLHE